VPGGDCPFAVLGLERDATPDDVKAAFRTAALRHHPDRNPHLDREEAEAAFRRASEAYVALSGVLSPAMGSTSDQWHREVQRQCDILLKQMSASGSGYGAAGGGFVHVGQKLLRRPDGTLVMRVETTRTSQSGKVTTEVEIRQLGGTAQWGDDQPG